MTDTQTNLLTPGATVHLLNNTKYAGCWTLAAVGAPDGNGWQAITGTNRMAWHTRAADAFATEADARAEAKSRRAPRRTRQVSGEWGMACLLVSKLDGKAAR